MGTAKFLADPIIHPTGHPLQGLFLSIGEDLLEPTDTPHAIVLPDDALKTNMVKITPLLFGTPITLSVSDISYTAYFQLIRPRNGD